MDPLSLITTAAPLLLSYFGKKKDQKIAKASEDRSYAHAADVAAQNYEQQKEFAQNSIKWRTEDAARSGIHPLAALGMQPLSMSPVSVGVSGGSGSNFGDLGQDLSRAMAAGETVGGRTSVVEKQVQGLTLQRLSLENELLAAKIAATQASLPPALPGLGSRVDEAGNPRTPGLVMGKPYRTSERMSDAEIYEQRYGDSEIAQTLIGAGIALSDLFGVGKRQVQRWMDKGFQMVPGATFSGE